MDGKRIVEIRLITIVHVNVTDPELLDALQRTPKPTSVSEMVSSEITSNLESISYVESAIVSTL